MQLKHATAFITTKADLLEALKAVPGGANIYDWYVEAGCYLDINGELTDEERQLIDFATAEDPPSPMPDGMSTMLILKWLCSQEAIEPGNWVIYVPPYRRRHRDRCA